ncbi:nicotinate (nicotinamide) nucleotide adenylyltransferase [Limnovirga soli]|uniref:Probable nicotinate-nucleotide adenylyltransferase n=1 Tax=Limnovirga soli TaxID=2656915 RepID=A0A8J8FCM4_9BACT|nr:nicotinate (nicotinamide) nucleotide adenylyltransferase [Limnovirga soli]NNV55543.1 nicotinate-nucleotide adenylyltransferase [Limnovirga soli]
MKIGLYFGSFNPIHVGHLIIANHVINTTNYDKIWFVVSPQNPLKPSNSLLNEYTRLHLVRLAIEDNPRFKVIDVEFNLPKPSYTIDTLTYLKEKYPSYSFAVILGSDSYQNLPKWKNYQTLINENELLVYERPGFPFNPHPFTPPSHTILLKGAPLLDISATSIRKLLGEGKSIQYLVSEKVREEINAAGYYKK